MNEHEILTTLLENLQTKVTSQIYEAYFAQLKIVELDENSITLACKNIFTKQAIENRFFNTLDKTLKSITGNPNLQVTLVIRAISDKSSAKTPKNDMFKPREPMPAVQATPNPSLIDNVASSIHKATESFLNPKYTFDKFIVGSHNQLAHAAGLAVSDSPGNAYNPLFIYGGVGLGKTHLMQAIGNKVIENNPNAKILYSPTELFLNEMVQGIRTQKMNAFREKYRVMDLLILDDIQFLSNKEGLQEEFFNTFNTLYQAGKQIIIASDRPPTEISHLEDRIRSRFEGGLVADIKSPNLETRIAILQKKLFERNEYLPDPVVEATAQLVDTNIRELEGALLKVLITYKTTGNITAKEVESLLGHKVVQKRKKINPSEVINLVCEAFEVEPKDVKSIKRNSDISQARQVCMYLLKDILKLQLVKIAKLVGRKDHTTVIHGINKIESSLDKDPTMRKMIEELRTKLNA